MHIYNERYSLWSQPLQKKKKILYSSSKRTELKIPREDNQVKTPGIAVLIITWFENTLHQNH